MRRATSTLVENHLPSATCHARRVGFQHMPGAIADWAHITVDEGRAVWADRKKEPAVRRILDAAGGGCANATYLPSQAIADCLNAMYRTRPEPASKGGGGSSSDSSDSSDSQDDDKHGTDGAGATEQQDHSQDEGEEEEEQQPQQEPSAGGTKKPQPSAAPPASPSTAEKTGAARRPGGSCSVAPPAAEPCAMVSAATKAASAAAFALSTAPCRQPPAAAIAHADPAAATMPNVAVQAVVLPLPPVSFYQPWNDHFFDRAGEGVPYHPVYVTVAKQSCASQDELFVAVYSLNNNRASLRQWASAAAQPVPAGGASEGPTAAAADPDGSDLSSNASDDSAVVVISDGDLEPEQATTGAAEEKGKRGLKRGREPQSATSLPRKSNDSDVESGRAPKWRAVSDELVALSYAELQSMQASDVRTLSAEIFDGRSVSQSTAYRALNHARSAAKARRAATESR